jgi:Tfp pilus assembly protein PilW
MNEHTRRGFTVTELALTITISSMIVASAGALYLEARIDFARSEANVVLVREASLAVEVMSRDLRNAKRATSDKGGVAVDVGDPEPVRFVIDRSGLVRDDGDDRVPIARFVRSVSVRDVNGGFRIELTMERSLAEGRRVRIVRVAFVGARRR